MKRKCDPRDPRDPTKSTIINLFAQLTPMQQREFLSTLSEEKAATCKSEFPWSKWRVWYVSPNKVDRKDYMYMYARTQKEAEILCNEVRRRKLNIIRVEIVP